jgi:hypothetical protein
MPLEMRSAGLENDSTCRHVTPDVASSRSKQWTRVHKYVPCTVNFRAHVAHLYSLASDTATQSSNLGIVNGLIGATLEVEHNNSQ